MISVIIPYNNEDNYLCDCIASLKEQTCTAPEIIITGQKDKVISALSSRGESLPLNTVFVELPEGTGVAEKRNAGLAAAGGEYIFFLDCDDYISADTLEALVKRYTAEQQKTGEPYILLRAAHHRTWLKKQSTEALRANAEAVPECDEEDYDDGNIDRTDLLPGILQEAEANRRARHGAASVTGILLPRALIDACGELRFDEKLRYYSDLPFVCRLVAEATLVTCEEAHYYKRSHDDPIRRPALCQEEAKDRQLELVQACEAALEGARRGIFSDRVREYLSNYLCNYILRHLAYTQHPKGLGWSEAELQGLSGLLRQVSLEVIDSYSGARRTILRRLAGGRFKAAKRSAVFYGKRRKKKGIFGNAQQWSWQLYKHIFSKMPVKKNLYLFESFLGKGYGDSPRYIYEYMLKSRPENAKMVWIVNDKNLVLPGKTKRVKYMSLRYFYYVARTGNWITNMRQPAWYKKREGVTLLQCWHGTPLKRLVFDMEDVHSASPKYKSIFYRQSRMWDYLISANEFSTRCFKSAFLFPEERILQLGYPRNDLLFAADREKRAQSLRKRLGIPADKKVVLYAPTWRDDEFYSQGEYKFKLPLDMELMRRLSAEYYFLLRTHYFISDRLQLSESDSSFVADMSRYNDIGELYLIADVLITDYSSVFFDYANLNRPILFYVYDFEKYKNVLRGFYFDMTAECPGPLLQTNGEVEAALKNIAAIGAEYADKYAEFRKKYCSLDDGYAAERVVKKVFGKGYDDREKNT